MIIHWLGMEETMNKYSNRQVMCDTIIEAAKIDSNICIVTTDSRGSASLTEFANLFPRQTIEVGIAEQNAVSIAAGLANGNMRPFVASPASFLSMRSIEQIKVDVAYSNMNVKLIGISGGVSYGALGMSHHSTQDFAVLNAIPNIEIYNPADQFETRALFKYLTKSNNPAYIRLGRNACPNVYDNYIEFVPGKVVEINKGNKVMIAATGECVSIAQQVAIHLKEKYNVDITVVNIHTIKPFDRQYFKSNLKHYKLLITMEEHSIYGGIGSLVSCVIAESNINVKQIILGIKDQFPICGSQSEIYEDNGLTTYNVEKLILDYLESNV